MGYSDEMSIPLRQRPIIWYVLSLLIALLTATVSIASILNRATIYPSEELQQAFLTNDIINLILGIPILIGAIWFSWRGSWVGLLLWPGAIVFGLYNYVVYLFGMPFTVFFPAHLAIVTLSIFTSIGLIASIDSGEIKDALEGLVPEKISGGILTGFGLLFILLAFSGLIDPLVNNTLVMRTELALIVADVIVSSALIIGGLLLWGRHALGYVCGLALLFMATMLFLGLILVLILQPLITSAPFSLVDVVVTTIMSLVTVVPLTYYLKGVIKRKRDNPL